MRGRTIVKTRFSLSGRIPLLTLLFLFLIFQNLYAGGTSEETGVDPLYETWNLCITQFDTSGLPSEKKIIGSIITRSVINQLLSLNARVRSTEETAFYSEYAWSQARLKAAQTLKAKRDERDALLFKGDTNWTYKSKLRKIDEEIKSLEEDYKITEADFPVVVEHPVFSLTQQNLSGTYPAVPDDGMEWSFCREQNIDGFLSGTVSEYYGRILVSIKLYTLYSQSYSYEDFALFSVENQQTILSELSSRLKAVLSGIEPSAIIVKAEPEDAIILMNDAYAGRGNSGEKIQEPGIMNVEVFAENYQKEEFQIDLFSGELTDVFINLHPVTYKAFHIDTSSNTASSVYLGSTFMGMTPLTLNLFSDQYEYISMENEIGETTSFIYDGSIPSAYVTLSLEESNGKTVEDYRKSFYGAYGRFWISLPLALLTYGLTSASVNSSNYSGSVDMYNNAVVTQNVFWGTAAVAGGFLIESLIRMGIYLYKSNSTDVRKL